MEFNKYFSIAKREVSEAIVDNKRLILLMASVYIISFIIAGIISSQVVNIFSSHISSGGSQVTEPSPMISALSLFIHNESAGILTYILSIFFGIDAFVSLIINGAMMGALGVPVMVTNPAHEIPMFLALTVPHGIFEIPASILESVAGMLLFLFIFRFFKTIHSTDGSSFKIKAKKSWEVNKIYFKQSIVIMVFCFVLLVIAAIIEGYVTDHVGDLVESFLK